MRLLSKLQIFSDYQLKTWVIIKLYMRRRETNRDRESLLHFLLHLRIRLIKTYGDFFYIERKLKQLYACNWRKINAHVAINATCQWAILWKVILVEPQNSKRTFIYLHDRPLCYSAIRGHREEIHVVIKVIFLPFYL